MKTFFQRSFAGAVAVFVALLFLGAGCTPAETEPTLELSKTSYEVGESIVVSFTAPEGYDSSAWIGVLPSDVAHGDESVNDSYDTDFEYLSNQTVGTVSLTAPTTPVQNSLSAGFPSHTKDVNTV